MTKFLKSTRRPGAQEASKIRATFNNFDEDHDGGINKVEFMKMMSALGIKLPHEDCMTLFEEMDLDKSGKIEIGEFLDHYYTILQLAEVCSIPLFPLFFDNLLQMYLPNASFYTFRYLT